jgi:hypothetical protein
VIVYLSGPVEVVLVLMIQAVPSTTPLQTGDSPHHFYGINKKSHRATKLLVPISVSRYSLMTVSLVAEVDLY